MYDLIHSLFLSFFITTMTLAQTPLELVQKHGEKFPINTEFSIAIINNNTTTYYGFIKTDTGFVQQKNETSVFEIGSLSKVFTSNLLAQEVQSGNLKLDQPIQKVLDFKLKKNPAITLLSLANHTSGLPRLPENIFPLLQQNPSNPYKDYDAEKLKTYCTKELKLNATVGEKYEYSNLGAGLLAYALSSYNKMSYEELLQKNIFKPLQMNASTTNRNLVQDKLVLGLDATGDVAGNWDFNALAGAGAILSTTEDLSKFVLYNLEDNNLVATLQQTSTFTINPNISIALGWHLVSTKSQKLYLWHNGATAGYVSFMAADTSAKKGVVILSNVSAFHPNMSSVDMLGFELMSF